MKFLIIHGFKASSKTNFFPWLKEELEKKGHQVIIPDLPNPEKPDPDEWIKTLLESMPIVKDDTIIIGHSLGAPTALRYLEAAEVGSTPKACILISPPWNIKSDVFSGFFLSELDFDVLMWKASRFVIIHDKEDKIIPFDHAEKYAEVLAARIIKTKGNGHFKSDRYPEILKVINKVIEEEVEYNPGQKLVDEYSDIDE